jgi:hypothetical protein
LSAIIERIGPALEFFWRQVKPRKKLFVYPLSSPGIIRPKNAFNRKFIKDRYEGREVFSTGKSLCG